jgi:hypothetical protein
MRRTLLLPIVMCCAAFGSPANALVLVDRPAAKSDGRIVTVAAHHHCKVGATCDSAAHCPPGTRWVPAKYGRAGMASIALQQLGLSTRPHRYGG